MATSPAEKRRITPSALNVVMADIIDTLVTCDLADRTPILNRMRRVHSVIAYGPASAGWGWWCWTSRLRSRSGTFCRLRNRRQRESRCLSLQPRHTPVRHDRPVVLEAQMNAG